jgi:hypothetical protein
MLHVQLFISQPTAEDGARLIGGGRTALANFRAHGHLAHTNTHAHNPLTTAPVQIHLFHDLSSNQEASANTDI